MSEHRTTPLVRTLVSMVMVAVAVTDAPAVPGPLRFEENHGQVDPRVRFLCRTSDYTLYLTPGEAVFDFARAGVDASMRLAFVGARADVELRGLDPLPGRTNYLIGKDHVDVPLVGTGYWYLARVDGATWNTVAQSGNRDATLVACP